jgi:hypothetical protein
VTLGVPQNRRRKVVTLLPGHSTVVLNQYAARFQEQNVLQYTNVQILHNFECFHIYKWRLRRGVFQPFIPALSLATNGLIYTPSLIAGSCPSVSVRLLIGGQGSIVTLTLSQKLGLL